MKARILFIACLVISGFSACEKNTVSKIPNITLIESSTLIRVNVDLDSVKFNIVDGDADLGGDTLSAIYWKDSRYDSAGYIKADFPQIDAEALDTKKGLQAVCVLYPVPQPTPRFDSIHTLFGDTLTYEFYVVDRAGNKSNHITTPTLIIVP